MARDVKPCGRKPRADAERNRTLLLCTAHSIFTERGVAVCVEDIARAAGVGIGTLYRHFPTREALIEEVYRAGICQLVSEAARLVEEQPPVEALRAWLLLFIDYFETKRIIAAALANRAGGAAEIYAAAVTQIEQAITLLAERAVASGDIRLTVPPIDLLRAVIGVADAGVRPGWEQNARAMVDILIAGSRVPPDERPVSSEEVCATDD